MRRSCLTRIVPCFLIATLTVLLITCARLSPATPTDQVSDHPATSQVVESTDQPSPSGAEPKGHILHIDTFDCGIPDLAVDFARRFNRLGLSVTPEIHAGLTRLVKDAQQQTTAAPELAESIRAFDDATRYEIRLRPGLRFSNGIPLLASHVKWSWERALRKSTPPSRARIVLGSIVDADAVMREERSELQGVEVVDDRTLTVALSEPQPDFPTAISDPVAAVLHPENVAGWDDVWINSPFLPSNTLEMTEIPLTTIPVGAGPFRLVEYIKPELGRTSAAVPRRCILERNPHYWDPNAPALDGIVATIYPDIWKTPQETANRQRFELENRTLDFAIANPASEDNIHYDDDNAPILVNGSTNPSVRLLMFNPSVAPFNESAVRKAFVNVAPPAATDGTTRATRIIPESIAPWPVQQMPNAAIDALTNQVAERALTVTLTSWGIVLSDQVRDAVVEAWKVSLNAEINIEPFQFINDKPVPPLHELQAAEFIIDTGATSPYDVLKSVLEAFGTDNMPPQFAELKAQLDNARHNLDAVTRTAEYQRIEQTILDEAYVLPIYADSWEFEALVQPWVHGLQYPLPGGSYYRDVWFDETAPERTLPVQ